MKYLKSVLALAVFSFLLIACNQENENIEESFDLTASLDIPIKDQIPHFSFDNSERGIYHGIIASTTNQSRGKIWINMGNDSNYNAYVAMVGGDELYFDMVPEAETQYTNPSIYRFAGISGGFVIDLTNFNQPLVTEVIVNNHEFHISVVKSRSTRMASSATATFQEFDNPLFGGTWNLISDGTIVDPNGNNGEGITALIVTMDGNVYTDVEFDNFNALNCLGNADFVPTINTNGIPNYIIVDNQTTPMAIGMAKWSLGFDPIENNYIKWMFCQVLPAGEFSWINNAGTTMKVGSIVLD